MRANKRLRVLRHALRDREGRPASSDIAFTGYLWILLIPLVIYPVGRALVVTLSLPDVVAVLSSLPAALGFGFTVGLIGVALVWAGAIYGPVTLEPVQVRLLAETDLARHTTLLRPFLQRAAGLIAVSALIGATLSGVLFAAGNASVLASALFVGSCLLLGWLGAICWLVGQVAGARAWWVGLLLSLPIVVGWLWPTASWVTPVGLFGATWPVADDGMWPMVGIALLCGAAIFAVRPLLDNLRGPKLLSDALQWQSAGRAATFGDVQIALGLLRVNPRLGRAWDALVDSPTIVRFIAADAVGACRTPIRFLAGTCTLIVAQVLVSTANAAAGSPGWLLAGLGGMLGFTALGVAADGLRHAVEVVVAPPLFDLGKWQLLSLHALLPLMVVAFTGVLGCGFAYAYGGRPEPIACALIGGIWVVARAWDAAKGYLPPWLLTPIPTPMGDLSPVNVAIWVADALIVSTLAAVGVVALIKAGQGLWAVAAVIAAIALLLVSLSRRIARL